MRLISTVVKKFPEGRGTDLLSHKYIALNVATRRCECIHVGIREYPDIFSYVSNKIKLTRTFLSHKLAPLTL